MPEPLKVLIVEDSEDDALLVLRQLQHGGYDITHERVDTAEAMAAALDKQTWDIILSDYSMPQFSGLAALKLWQEKGLDLPFIIVSGKIGEETAVETMKAGAHDYIMKNNLKRLVPAVKRELEEAEVRRKRRLVEKQNSTILRTTRDGFALVDAQDGHFLDVNDAYCHLVGYSRDELLSMGIGDVGLEETPGEIARHIQQIIESGRKFFEARQRRKDGRIVYIEVSISYMDIEGGRLFAFVRDITERKRVAEARRVAEENFRHSLDSSPLGIRVVSAEGELLYANQSILDICGYSSFEELKNKPAKERYTPGSYIEHRKRIENRKLGKPVPPDYEISIVRKDGEVRYLAVFRKEVVWDRKTQFQTLYQDITERKQAEEALKRSEQSYRELAESISDVFFAMNGELRFTYWNKACEKLTGVSAKDALGKHTSDLFPRDEARRIGVEAAQKLERTGQFQQYITRYQFGGKDLIFEVSIYPSHDGRSILAKDITERMKTEKALRDSEQKYRQLVDDMNDGYGVIQNGKYVFANRRFGEILGCKPEQVPGQSIAKFMMAEYRQAQTDSYERVMHSKEALAERYEGEMIREDGTKTIVESSNRPIQYEGKSAIGIIIRDITERKQAEEQLRESAARLYLIFESVSDGIAVINLNGVVTQVNERLVEMGGFSSKEELLGKTVFEFVAPRDHEKLEMNIRRTTEQGTMKSMQYTIVGKDGSESSVEVGGGLLRDASGNPMSMVAAIRDITERKQAEEQLRESAERLRLIFAAASDGIAVTDLNGVFTQVNRKMVEMCGFSSGEEMLGKTAFEFTAPRDREKLEMNIRRTVEQGILMNMEYTMVRKDGSEIPIEGSGGLLRDASGNPMSMVAVLRDITERKKAEEAIRASEEKYRLVVENAHEAIVVVQDGIVKFFNPQTLSLAQRLGYSSEEVASKPFIEFIHPADRKTVIERYLMSIEGKPPPTTYPIRVTDKGGNVRWLEVSAVLITWEGRPAMLNFLNDITERKKAEEQLRESAERLHLVFEAVSDGIAVINLNGVFTQVNRRMVEMCGFSSEEELLGKTAFEFTAPRDREKLEMSMRQTVEQGTLMSMQYTIVRKDGSEIPTETGGGLLRDASGNPMSMVAVMRDITERKQAEEALKQSLDKLQRTIEGTIQAIVLIAETRDPYTAGHQRRVAKLAGAIAEEMGLSKEQIETILVAGTLHDVGKVCVPAEILSKPGRLTNTEMELIKNHSQVGREILKTIKFPWPICPIVLQHHERMDGSGYPSGISGENITLEARILAVADVVEAMSSHRPYRPALGIDKALEEISRNRSRLYDPKVVDACLRLFTEKGFKFEE